MLSWMWKHLGNLQSECQLKDLPNSVWAIRVWDRYGIFRPQVCIYVPGIKKVKSSKKKKISCFRKKRVILQHKYFVHRPVQYCRSCLWTWQWRRRPMQVLCYAQRRGNNGTIDRIIPPNNQVQGCEIINICCSSRRVTMFSSIPVWYGKRFEILSVITWDWKTGADFKGSVFSRLYEMF